MPRPLTDAHDDDISASKQLARIDSRLRSLDRGQLDIQKALQQLCTSLKSGDVLDAGKAEKLEATGRVSATELALTASMNAPKKFEATERASTASMDSPKNFEATERVSAAQRMSALELANRVSQEFRQTIVARTEDNLRRIFQVAEVVEAEHQQTALEQSYSSFSYMATKKVFSMSRHEVEAKVDLIIGVVILLNGFFIGLAMDYKDEHLSWMLMDVMFSVIFISELLFKIWVHGFVQQFCGSSAIANCFDAFLIFLDLVQLMIELVSPSVAKALDSAPSASLFRVIRLLRLTRLVRAMKSDVFNSLAEIIHGIAAGMTTLAWSIVLFFLFVYTLALVLREALGRQIAGDIVDKSSVREMFDSVPRSVLTTYRCSFGDCSLPNGTPLFESVLPFYGAGWVLFYSMAMFVVTVVLFNVISAMFVERTMAAAEALTAGKRIEKLGDERFLFWKVTALIKRILEITPELDVPWLGDNLSEHINDVMQMEVPMSVMDDVIKDPEIVTILNDLDIHPQDHRRLSDIFDPDNNGTLELADVASGIRRMRGEPRRSDIVCIDLMIRSIQPVLAETLEAMAEIKMYSRIRHSLDAAGAGSNT